MAGLAWGLVTGDYATSLKIAIFYELFWLDNIPAGAYIPPHILAPTFAALTLTSFFGFTEAPQVVFILITCLPLANLGTWVESALRQWHNRGYNELLGWAGKGEAGDNLPSRLIVQAIFKDFGAYWLFFCVSTAVLYYVLGIFFHRWGELLTTRDMEWSSLCILASLGGLLSLRLRKAYAILALAVAFVGLFFLS